MAKKKSDEVRAITSGDQILVKILDELEGIHKELKRMNGSAEKSKQSGKPKSRSSSTKNS